MTIDLRQEANEFRTWLEQKVADPTRRPFADMGAIVCLFNFDQSGWIAIDFNTDDPFEPDCDVSKQSWDDLFERKEWTALYNVWADSEHEQMITYITADGSESSESAVDFPVEFIASHLGKLIRDVLTLSLNDGVFNTLPRRAGCEVDIWDFNGAFGWNAKEQGGQLTAA